MKAEQFLKEKIDWCSKSPAGEKIYSLRESEIISVMEEYKNQNTELDLQKEHEIDCPECEGEGTYEDGPICTRPASQCCGGCYETRVCEKCNGRGTVFLDHEALIELKELEKVDKFIREVVGSLEALGMNEESAKEVVGNLVKEIINEI